LQVDHQVGQPLRIDLPEEMRCTTAQLVQTAEDLGIDVDFMHDDSLIYRARDLLYNHTVIELIHASRDATSARSAPVYA
jgi:hypothetical protein